MSDHDATLDGLRSALDDVDQQIVHLVARRFDLVAGIGRVKSDNTSNIRDADREAEVFAAVADTARELGLSAVLVRRIFEEIVRHSISRQAAHLAVTAAMLDRPLRLSFQGGENAYSYLAAGAYSESLGLPCERIGCRTFREALDLMLDGTTDLAVLPIENTTAGSITGVYDLLRTEDVSVVGEELWRVDHCLAAPADVPLEHITRVLSHPQGLEQCSVFLGSLPHIEQVSFVDTAEALRAVAEANDPTQAAIGSTDAALGHGLTVLAQGISNQEENYTRFVVLAAEPQPVDLRVPCKTSLVLGTRHEHGALLRCLRVIDDHGLSMTKLESRPHPGRPWEYMFFLDFEGNVDDPRVTTMLDELRLAALFVKVLGSYPAKTVVRG